MTVTLEAEQLSEAELAERLGDQEWRLNNLYWIKDKNGRKVKFRMNWAQRRLFNGLWYWNLILKARQLGISTFINLLQLDTCLFNDNVSCGVIAHDREAVQELFRNNIEFPFANLPESIKATRKPTTDTKNQYVFPNGSSIRVATSVRGGTVQMLHVSEFGKICARYPHRAKEVVTGSFEAVGLGNLVFVESTAEGREGYFYEYTEEARARAERGDLPNPQQFKFFFFPWYEHPDYRLRDVRGVVITEERQKYFDELEQKLGISLPLSRRAWYVNKAGTLGEDMLREYPSLPEEAFFQSIMGAYYRDQLQRARKEGRIGAFPALDGYPVMTWWDIGVDDATAIWFVQQLGGRFRFIDYYENSGEQLEHYVRVLQEKGYFYASRHIAPHDIRVREWVSGSRLKAAERMGIAFDTAPALPIADGIEMVRNLFPSFEFDLEGCDEGLKRLENYRKEWDELRGCYKPRPLHDWTSHGADALRTGVTGLQKVVDSRAIASKKPKPTPRAWS